MPATSDEVSGALGTAPRLIGFVGNPGRASEIRRVLAAAHPDLDMVVGSDGLVVLVDIERERARRVTRDDGSFLVISGRWFDDQSLDAVLESWLIDGERALDKVYFHGLIAAWNAHSGRLALVRDRFGVETGYYSETGDGLLFCDEQRPLISAGIDSSPDPIAIDAFLATGYFPAPLTPYLAVRKLAPGAALVDDGVKRSLVKWAHYNPGPPIPYDEAVRRAPDVLRSSVERIWPSSGEVGLLLSGGIDSAMVLASITEMIGQRATAFTFRYEDYEGPLNEFDAARIVTSHLQVQHEEIRIRPGDLIDDLHSAVAAYGEPLNWGLHSYRLAPIADAGMSAVFSGVGADSTGITKRHQAALRFYRLPGPLQAVLRSAVRLARPLHLPTQTKAEWVTRSTDGVAELFSPDGERNRESRAQLYNDRSLALKSGRHLAELFTAGVAGLDSDDPRLVLIIMDKIFTSAEAMMAWNRAWPRAHGLTACLPFFDPDIIDLGLRVQGDTSGKDLIRRVAERYLPAEVASAPKIAQQIPVSHWLRGSLAGPAREILSDLPSSMTNIFDGKQVVKLIDNHLSGKGDEAWRIISLLTLATWFRQNEALTG